MTILYCEGVFRSRDTFWDAEFNGVRPYRERDVYIPFAVGSDPIAHIKKLLVSPKQAIVSINIYQLVLLNSRF